MNATPAAPKVKFPYKVTVPGISGIIAKVYRQEQEKGGECYESFVLSYNLLGKRKQERFNKFELAQAAGEAAIKAIANGEQAGLELRNGALFEYQRAKEILEGHNVKLDTVCQIWVDCMTALAGKGNPVEACQEYAKRHGAAATKAMIPDAVKEMIAQEEKQQEGKRKVAWVKLLKTHVENKFAADFNKYVHLIEPGDLTLWLAKLDCAERTKKNIRDTLKHFFKWCRGRGYLPKDSDPLADVPDFRKRKRGKIHIFTPEQLSLLLSNASEEFLPYIAIRAFAGLRDAEAKAIDWRQISLETGWIEITEEVAKASDDEEGLRRLIPIRDCLKAWLTPRAKQSGRLCPFDNTSKQIAALCEMAGVKWERNALRHSNISYAIAESNDIPQVAIHSGNSPAVIRQHYLRVVKPEAAKAWFSVVPAEAATGAGLKILAHQAP